MDHHFLKSTSVCLKVDLHALFQNQTHLPHMSYFWKTPKTSILLQKWRNFQMIYCIVFYRSQPKSFVITRFTDTFFFDPWALVKQIWQNPVFRSDFLTFYFIDALIFQNKVFGHCKILHELTSLSKLSHSRESIHFFIKLKAVWNEKSIFVFWREKRPKSSFSKI